MKARVAFVILLLANCICPAFGAGFEYPPSLSGARAEVYRQVGETALKVYIFEPAEAKTNRPAIVFFFGGDGRRVHRSNSSNSACILRRGAW